MEQTKDSYQDYVEAARDNSERECGGPAPLLAAVMLKYILEHGELGETENEAFVEVLKKLESMEPEEAAIAVPLCKVLKASSKKRQDKMVESKLCVDMLQSLTGPTDTFLKNDERG